MKAPWSLHIVEGGDHSFHVPKSLGKRDEQIFDQLVNGTLDWLSQAAR